MNFFQYLYFQFNYKKAMNGLLSRHLGMIVSIGSQYTSIDEREVPSWHLLENFLRKSWAHRKCRTLNGYGLSKDGIYRGQQSVRPEYSDIGLESVVDNWTCDISDLHGFGASKSELLSFKSTDEMVEANSKDMISEITDEKLAENLAHREIRILHNPNTTDHFTKYAWDGRLFLSNAGGSHHLAAAKYIAKKLNRPVTLTGRLFTYSLNQNAIKSLTSDYEIFMVSNSRDVFHAFIDVMETLKVTWFFHNLPRPCDQYMAILLPKEQWASCCVAECLHHAGCFNLGEYLAKLASSQVN